MLARSRVALALAMLVSGVDAADVTSCSREETKNAASAAVDVRNWEAMYDAFHRFGHCGDRAVAAGFTHSIVWMLDSRWQDLHDLEHFAEANRRFRVFVLQHIDATADERGLRRILARAKDCPGHARPLCREIEGRVQAALKEH